MGNLLNMLQSLGLQMNFMSGAIGVAAYILQALALYTIATRREINKPWLAWVPVVNVWILGSVSDQYHYVTKREVKNMRKLLLGLSIAVAAISVASAVIFVGIFVHLVFASSGLFTGILPGSDYSNITTLSQAVAGKVGGLLALLLLLLALVVVLVILTIDTWIAIYDLFRSCDPANATVYLVVSIIGGFVVSGVHTIFMMICRNKDLGMPPRRVAAEPVVEYQPDEPWVQE